MTKDVLITISGLHYDDNAAAQEEEPIEVTSPAVYYYKNGKHYVLYEELVEGIPGVIKNRIKFQENGALDITKSGITDAHMTFEKDRIHVAPYDTPYGEIMVGTYTRELNVDVKEDLITVYVSYSLDANGDKL